MRQRRAGLCARGPVVAVHCKFGSRGGWGCRAQADILHTYRTRVLGTGSLFRLRHYHRPLAHAPVPTSYTFSPALLPPPADWPRHVHVTGFCRLQVPCGCRPAPRGCVASRVFRQ
jgi:hypothetical protein